MSKFLLAVFVVGLLMALLPMACVDLAIRTGVLVEKK